MAFSLQHRSWRCKNSGKHSYPDGPQQGELASSTFESLASKFGGKRSLCWYRRNNYRYLLDLHFARVLVDVSLFLFRSCCRREHFVPIITVDNNCHKRGQTSGFVVGAQIQTSCDPKASICGCYCLLGLSRFRECCSWLFQPQWMGNFHSYGYTSLSDDIHLLLYQDFP